jgi:type VI protein secretion system component VasK
MWILNLIPDAMLNWVYWTIIAVGTISIVLGWLGKFIPFYGSYAHILKPTGVVILLLGVWLRGGYDTEMAWRAKVDEAQAQVAKAEQESNKANEALAKKGEDKVKYIKGRTEYITRYIDKEIIKYDTKFMPGGQCEIPTEFIRAHNDSAEVPKK